MTSSGRYPTADKRRLDVGAESPTPDEARRTLALTLAVELRGSPDRDITTGYVTRTARAFEAYLRDGTVER